MSEEIKEYGFVVGHVTEGKVYKHKPGKKAQRPLDISLSDGTRRQFEFRVDEGDGKFIAISEDGERYWSATSKKALTIKLVEVVRQDAVVSWTRYIDVEYTAYLDSNYDRARTLGDEREPGDQVIGLKLELSVVEYSDVQRNRGRDERRTRTLVDADEGGPDRFTESHWVGADLPPGLLPYSPERLATLRKVQEVIASADRAVLALVSGSPEELAARVDERRYWLEASGSAMPLLVAPTDAGPATPEKKPRKRGSAK